MVFNVQGVYTASEKLFDGWLRHPRFAGAFDRVVFAVFDAATGRPNFEVFRRIFAIGTGR